jgi:hypothetical protein
MAALGLMAFSATSALAVNLNVIDEPETGEAGFFLINNGTKRPTGLTHETVGGSAGPGKLLIPGKAAEIACESAQIVKNAAGEEAFIQNESENYLKAAGTMKAGGHGHGTVLFLGCKVFKISAKTGALEGELGECTKELNKPLLADLKVEPITHHVRAEGLILVKKHEISTGVFATYIVVEPLAASEAKAKENAALTSAFTTITFGGTCSLPETVKVTGGAVVKAPATDTNKPVLNVKTYEFVEKESIKESIKYSTEQELLGAKLKFGANEAFLEGTATAELTGGGAALSWGAM